MKSPRKLPNPGMLFAALLLLIICGASSVPGQSASPTDEDAEAEYLTATPNDPVARLQKRINRGEVRLDYYDRHGYLRAVLRELGIPYASQTLVFSKTSFQRDLISPTTPRALYFNDQSYVGWVQDGMVLEIATTDPRQGQIFYTLEQQKAARPRFVRQTFECLTCHRDTSSQNMPTLLARSVFTRADGNPDFGAGTFVTTPRSPLEERWGGWYVTGQHGGQRHMGNAIARGTDGSPTLDTEAGANINDLSGRLNISPYLSRQSDIVALMVLAHQIQIHNLITKAGYLTRNALRDERTMNTLDQVDPQKTRPATQSRVQHATEPLVQALLFSGEATLTNPITGSRDFSAPFVKAGPRDAQGRSLRDLDLKRRLFRYPCSFLIYSDAFNALPALAKNYVYQRFCQIFSGQDQSAEFTHLSAEDRQSLCEILTQTKPDFATFVAEQAKQN